MNKQKIISIFCTVFLITGFLITYSNVYAITTSSPGDPNPYAKDIKIKPGEKINGIDPRDLSSVNTIEIFAEDLLLSKTDYKAGETITGTFTLRNEKDENVPNVRYKIFLMGDYSNAIFHKIYDFSNSSDILFFAGKEKKTINFSYKIPESISGKNLGIEVRTTLDSGLALGWANEIINVTDGTGIATTKNASISVNEKDFYLQEGPTVYPGQKVTLKVILENSTKNKITFTPYINFYKRSEPDKIIYPLKGEILSIDSGKQSTVNIDLPFFDNVPQVYIGEISFLDEGGIMRASKLEFRYIIGGDIVTINSVTSDKIDISKGQPINITINYSGTPEDISSSKPSTETISDFNIKIFNQRDKLIADYSDKTDFNKGYLKNISLIAGENALAMRAEITVTRDGKKLASYNTFLSPDYRQKNGKIDIRDILSLKNIVIVITISIILLIIILIIFRKKILNNKILKILGFISLILISNFLLIDKARATIFEDGFAISPDCWFNKTFVNVYVNSPSEGSTLFCGQNINFQLRATSGACSNVNRHMAMSAGGSAWQTFYNYASDGSMDNTINVPMTVASSAGTTTIYFAVEYCGSGCCLTLYKYINYSVICPNPTCSVAAKEYAYNEAFPYNPSGYAGPKRFCNNGNVNPAPPADPPQGGSSRWTCSNSNGSRTCTATREWPPPSGSCSVSPTSAVVGQNVTWTATASGGNGSYSYSWSGTDGLSGTSRTKTKSYSTAGTKTGTVRITSDGKSTNINCSNSVLVSYPDVTASCSVSPTSAVVGQNVTWTATASGGNGSYTYGWTGTGVLNGKTGNPVTVQYPSGGTKTGTVTVNSGGKSKTANCNNNVIVRYEPVTNLNTSCTCNGTTSTLTASWESPASNFLVRMDYADNNTGSCTDGWYCASPPDYQNNSYTSKSFSTSNLPNGSYDFWVHAGTTDNYGPENKIRNIQCQCAKCGTEATGGDGSATPSGGWHAIHTYGEECRSWRMSGNELCEAGTANPASVYSPILGDTVSWTCGGKNCSAASTCPDSGLRIYNGGTIKIAGIRDDVCSSASPLKLKGSDGYIYDILLVDPGDTTHSSGQKIQIDSSTVKATAKCP